MTSCLLFPSSLDPSYTRSKKSKRKNTLSKTTSSQRSPNNSVLSSLKPQASTLSRMMSSQPSRSSSAPTCHKEASQKRWKEVSKTCYRRRSHLRANSAWYASSSSWSSRTTPAPASHPPCRPSSHRCLRRSRMSLLTRRTRRKRVRAMMTPRPMRTYHSTQSCFSSLMSAQILSHMYRGPLIIGCSRIKI